MMELLQQIFNAGLVGAGGAGFPTHKKLTDKADILIVNAVECEPLLASDRYLMRHFSGEIIESLKALRSGFDFSRVVIGTKEKYEREIKALETEIEGQSAGVEIYPVKSFYPAGDEQTLVYEITGKTIPPGGIPLQLGIVVLNVTTVYQIYLAMADKPFTQRFLSVVGEVGNPTLVKAPTGTSLDECIAAAGNALPGNFAVIRGGPMMGRRLSQTEAAGQSVSKTDGGLIVLDIEHPLIQFSRKPLAHMINQAKSVCIQCSYCTEMCPRYLIGHQMRPHRVMRSIATGRSSEDLTDALLCCECGICELYACPMQLSPRRMNIYVKEQLREADKQIEDQQIYSQHLEMRDYRLIAQSRFIERLGLSDYLADIDEVVAVNPGQVRIATRHGVGKPARPVVSAGDLVEQDQVIAAVEQEEMGAMVHASVTGQVIAVEDDFITIKNEEVLTNDE